MRSKAPPPMSAREAMQFRRDGAQRSSRTGVAELSKACARQGEDRNASTAPPPASGQRKL
jgi:hypothetical protein